MAICKAINSAGIVCNQKANDSTYFWFYDPNGRINQVFHLCKLHSNLIINDLMEKENAYNNLIRACYDQIEKVKKELQSGNNLCLLYTSPSPRDLSTSRMPSSA